MEAYFFCVFATSKDAKNFINKKEDIIIEIEQKFMAYDGKLKSSSGLYIFNPHHEASELK